MKERDMNNDFVPDEYDPVLDDHLRALGHFSPTPDFEARVMARVHPPTPAWSQRVAHGAEWGRLRRWTRSLAAVSVISITIVAVFVVTNATQLTAFLTARFGGLAVAAWRATLGLVSAAAVELYGFFGAGALSSLAIVAFASLVAAAVLFNTWALYRLMQPPETRAIRTP